MNRLAIVILNWNGAEDTQAAVNSISLNRDDAVLIIDNGSSDDDYKQVFSLSSDSITIIRNKKNLGFAGGVNTGIRWAIENNYSYVALLNNDAVIKKGWQDELITALGSNKVSIATGLLLNESGKKIDSTGEQYSTWGLPFPRSRGLKTAQAPKSGFVFGATGGATLYKTELFKEIGLFDESFFAYYEDVDISFRAQLVGHQVYYTNKAIAYHKQGATSKKIPGFTVYQTFKNLPLLYTKNVPAGLLIPIGLKFFVAYWLMFGNAIKNGTGWYALKGWLASVWYFFTSAIWKRFTIQANKKVSTSYIKSILHADLPPDQTGLRALRKRLTGK
jgi:GT2 family glycosyltransferase